MKIWEIMKDEQQEQEFEDESLNVFNLYFIKMSSIFGCSDQCATPVRPFLRKAGLRKGWIGRSKEGSSVMQTRFFSFFRS